MPFIAPISNIQLKNVFRGFDDKLNFMGLRLVEKATKKELLYTEEAGLRDLLITYGFHLIEGKWYAPLRQKLLQQRVTVIQELDEIDKTIVLLLTAITTYLLKFKTIRQLLSTHPAEKTLKYISWFLSRQKYKKLSQMTAFLNSQTISSAS